MDVDHCVFKKEFKFCKKIKTLINVFLKSEVKVSVSKWC